MIEDPKVIVSEIVQLVGKPEAQRLLIIEKVSPSTARELVKGTYGSEVKALITDAIKRAREAAKRQAQ